MERGLAMDTARTVKSLIPYTTLLMAQTGVCLCYLQLIIQHFSNTSIWLSMGRNLRLLNHDRHYHCNLYTKSKLTICMVFLRKISKYWKCVELKVEQSLLWTNGLSRTEWDMLCFHTTPHSNIFQELLWGSSSYIFNMRAVLFSKIDLELPVTLTWEQFCPSGDMWQCLKTLSISTTKGYY